MANYKPRTLRIGTISKGTLRTNDLMSAFLDALDSIELPRGERTAVNRVRERFEKKDEYDGIEDDLDELTLILEDHCPEFTRFGSHEGDGALFGVWPDHDAFDGSVRNGTASKGEELPRIILDWRKRDNAPLLSHFMVVNDHGNATLYRRARNRWIEVWAVV